MAQYTLGWADLAIDQYLALPSELQRSIDARVAQLLVTPDGSGTSYDPSTDHWTTTAATGEILLVYVFRVGLPRLVILRLVRF